MGLIGAQTTRAAVSAPVMLSVIINNYNYEQFVSKAIESLLEHKPGGLEIIVVNDCSTDPPRDVILGYQRRNPGRHSPYPDLDMVDCLPACAARSEMHPHGIEA